MVHTISYTYHLLYYVVGFLQIIYIYLIDHYTKDEYAMGKNIMGIICRKLYKYFMDAKLNSIKLNDRLDKALE